MADGEGEHLLDRFCRIAAARPGDVYLTQPMGGGRFEDLTFGRVLDEAQRMASFLRALGHPPGSRIAIASRNCAHFFLADLAIWLAGHVSVPLFPTLRADVVRFTLEHSLSDDERAMLHASLRRAEEEIAAGKSVPAADILRELRAAT